MPNAYSLLATNSYLHDMERLPDDVRCGQLPETHARLAENPRHPGLGSEECRGINQPRRSFAPGWTSATGWPGGILRRGRSYCGGSAPTR